MNYRIIINNITITEKSMSLAISGEIEDEGIVDGVFSKPKLIMLFENGEENRRIPFVINEIGYFGNKCTFSGEYIYALDMLFWKTRAKQLPFTMTFALSYGNYYYDKIDIDSRKPVIDCDNECFSLDYKCSQIDFTSHISKTAYKNTFGKTVIGIFTNILHLIMYIIGICLLPLFFIESLLLLALGGTHLAVKYDGSIIGAIIGHCNRKVEMVSTWKFTIRKMNRAMILLFYTLFKICKVKDNKISFISARRDDVSGNFAFVYDELKKNDGLDIHFILNTKTIRQLNLADIIKFCYACATSKVIVLDEFTPQIHFIDLKPQTKLIQLWHACGAFKTFGFTRLGKPKGSPQPTRNHRNYDYVTVSSKYCKRCHSEGFGIPYDNVVPTGIPRTDVFFDSTYKKKVTNEFYSSYPQFKDNKIIMFAPTFRGDVKETSFYPFEMFDVGEVCKALPDDYIIIIKHHPFITKKHPIPDEYKNRVIDLSESTEINDLLFISDVIITDYSSLIFEASLLDIPMIFYTFDLDEYIRNRDFYFDLRLNSPGKLVYDLESLIDTIKTEDYQTEKIPAFRDMFFDNLDGKSTDRVAKLIIDALNSKSK